MSEIDAKQALITFFNIVILGGLPFWAIWHAVRIKAFKYWSFEWFKQIICVIVYIGAINCEIPALWSRVLAYYVYRLTIPGELYTLTAWDRWGRLLFYFLFILYTWMDTMRRVPNYVKQMV